MSEAPRAAEEAGGRVDGGGEGAEGLEKRSDVFLTCQRPGCGVEFEPEARGKPQKWCSPNCRKRGWEERELQKAGLRWGVELMNEKLAELEAEDEEEE